MEPVFDSRLRRLVLAIAGLVVALAGATSATQATRSADITLTVKIQNEPAEER